MYETTSIVDFVECSLAYILLKQMVQLENKSSTHSTNSDYIYVKQMFSFFHLKLHIVCPRSSYPFYIISYYIKWVDTSWTYSIYSIIALHPLFFFIIG